MTSWSKSLRAAVAPIIAGAALAACAMNEPPKVDENLFPSAYKKMIIDHVMVTKQYDPTNIREAAITEPTLRPIAGDVQRYAVCVRFNARNDVRVYTGLTERIAYFFGGELNQFQVATKEQCAWATYQPWPELEKICLSERGKCT